MRSLLYTVLLVYVAAVILYLLKVMFVGQLVMMELLGVGIVFAKFAYDYYQNRKASDSYLRHAVYSALAFVIYTGAMFSMKRIPLHFSIVLYLFSLLIFAMIGVNDSLRAMKNTKTSESTQKGIFYLSLFALHGLYAFILASAFLKGFNMQFLIPAIIGIDLLVLLPFIIIKKAYNQYLVVGLFVISLSINSYLMVILQGN